MSKRSIWILGDQLTPRHPALTPENRSVGRVVMIESRAQGAHLRYHKIKLAMVYAAMRHFAAELRAAGWDVDYHPLEDTADFSEGIRKHNENCRPAGLLMMSPNSLTEESAVRKVAKAAGLSVEMLAPVQFLRSRADFRAWADGKKRLLMETHYREMRRRLGVLMDAHGEPEGGRWNYDAENRVSAAGWEAAGRPVPAPVPSWKPDEITRAAIRDVGRFFPDAPGEAEKLWLPVTRRQALEWLRHFVQHRLPLFGSYEDTMLAEQPLLFHSVLSAPINLGLLDPMECVEAAVQAGREGRAPLHAVEGFVRQILGWREFVNGVYWWRGREYASSNELGAHRPLPGFFYTGRTDMRCLRLCIEQVRDTAYNHHIQRLMILGNFLLLAGVSPREALRWFTEMYCDAFEWVMAANVLGMSLHADGGLMATKPYAASAAYISKMSDYCRGCRYRPSVRSGPGACPYNLLYWRFYDRHADRFAANPRTAVMVQQWRKRSPRDRATVLAEAERFLDEHAPAG